MTSIEKVCEDVKSLVEDVYSCYAKSVLDEDSKHQYPDTVKTHGTFITYLARMAVSAYKGVMESLNLKPGYGGEFEKAYMKLENDSEEGSFLAFHAKDETPNAKINKIVKKEIDDVSNFQDKMKDRELTEATLQVYESTVETICAALQREDVTKETRKTVKFVVGFLKDSVLEAIAKKKNGRFDTAIEAAIIKFLCTAPDVRTDEDEPDADAEMKTLSQDDEFKVMVHRWMNTLSGTMQ